MKLSSRLLALLGCMLPTVLGQALPLHTSSRWILDANNQRVKFRCINWAGHMETHVPEGLHKQSIDFLADWIKNNNFNCVRLTYSIDHALNPGLKVSDAFVAAAKPAGVSVDAMKDLYNKAVVKNPFLTNATTQDVYGAIVDALWKRGVMTILDNHVSRAGWCCDLKDGNGWWDSGWGYTGLNSRYFHTPDWISGLQAMATWANGHKGIVAMSLRNEIREFLLQGTFNGRQDWYDQIGQAGRLVHKTNPDMLIVVGGTQSATDLMHIRANNLDFSGWSGKHVWEFHAYSFTVTFPDPLESCDVVKAEYGLWDGFVLEQGKPYTAPLILSEFGAGMMGGPNGGLSDKDKSYLDCIANYMSGNDAEWSLWALQGSYYARDKSVDNDESYGALNHDWTDWRNPGFPAMMQGMWKVTQGP